MNEDVVADFTARFFLSRGEDGGEMPSNGRIILTRKRLVLATNDERTTVPLSTVIDVNVGTVPNHVKRFFDDTITIGYETESGVRSAVIESQSETVSKFVAILFRCLLNGRTVAVKHPARVGGRVKDTPVVTGKIRIKSRAIDVATESKTFSIDVESVMKIGRTNELGQRDDRVTLTVKYIENESGLTKTTLISPTKSQYVNLLARYLRLEFDELREEVEEIELTNPEKRVLVSVHATGGDIDFTNMLDGDPAYVTNVLNSVQTKDLIVEQEDGIALTPKGRIVVSQRIEDVNT
ncbi:CheF family chemotaxis protein [Natrarchaeobius chitinivorans]|uniref:Fla operon protein n=1 Tax=Natrarchaeobius chitinivorans TaxID=1679083 RepID=A0A3N6LTW0_NATCH|nr:CheF family chemotaxis protein [Natrarchaeobius chitinivorans]RQG93583.1 fla operon protein [Natrarchaeobius chitinivorans]